MGLDVGSKTIGVAVSDELGFAAHPVTTIARAGTAPDAAAVAALVAEREVGDVVVGWPLELDGSEGPRVRRVKVFEEALRGALPESVGMHRWDERFSTAAVERVLIEGDVSRRRRKQVVDKQAAAYILQGWLDGRRPSG
ncbi:MAG TPA: Holliday junction resolvase RuvX [Kofleriaceae bacterium]|jgi:putative Holliday junction resolvase